MRSKRFIFLSSQFYQDYPHTSFPEIETKDTRPYIQVCVRIDGIQFALPLCSNINHPHAFWTDKENRCGIDYTKAVVIKKEIYIDENRTPRLREAEFKALLGRDYEIKTGFKGYIRLYKKAKANDRIPRNQRIVAYSTLQYFEDCI